MTITRIWMKKFIVIIFIILIYSDTAAQISLPIIKASSDAADIRDGSVFQKRVWNLSPQVRPDIYYVRKPYIGKTVTFYTDIDSISFEVRPGEIYDFLIVLNEKDTCYTQINFIEKKVAKNSVEVIKIKPDSLREDFLYLIKSLQQEHPGLYRYVHEETFARLSDSLLQTLNHPMNQFEFGTLIRFFLSSIEDGHTNTSLSPELMQYYSEHVKMFPVQLCFIDEKAYTVCGEFAELPPGTEILSIDDEPINNIRKKLLRYISGDGKIETKKYWILNRDGFPYLYNWVYGEKTGYAITYITPNGDIKTVYLKSEHIQESCLSKENDNDQYLKLDYRSNNAAVLTIRTFSGEKLMQTGEDFESFLYTAFTGIKNKNVDKLIIDLRNNSGGDDAYGALLYSYLADKPFPYFASIEAIAKKISLKDNRLLGLQQPSAISFRGKVFFLINGLCFSTTSDFCAIAKSEDRGKFVGEETGGAYYGNTSGGIYRTALPHSGINIVIPKNKYTNAVKKDDYPGRGIIPDYRIIPAINDILNKRDVQFKYVLNLAQ
jgi:hypothetical protein